MVFSSILPIVSMETEEKVFMIPIKVSTWEMLKVPYPSG